MRGKNYNLRQFISVCHMSEKMGLGKGIYDAVHYFVQQKAIDRV